MTIDAKTLTEAIGNHAAFRRVRRLQPIGGQGDKIFPPTYPPERRGAPPRHVFERRRVEGKEIWCVLIDSVQSQANRMEEALLAAADEEGDDGRVKLPYVKVDFSGAGLEPLERITSLDAPHRVYDAILRDSLLDGTPFMQSEDGRRLAAATPANATVLLELSPTALLFGAWHSQGEGGGLGAKFPRALVSEIMGIDTPVEEIVSNRYRDRSGRRLDGRHVFVHVEEITDGRRTSEMEARTAGRRTGSRIDPLGILRKVEVFKGVSASDWSMEKDDLGKSAKKVRPSEINHSNIAPTVEPLGVTCDHAEHRATITLAGLRRLRFGGGEKDAAGRALLASLGLLALAEQDARGYALRSRCDLVCDGEAPLEVVRADGSTAPLEIDRAAARALYREAYVQAEAVDFQFRSLRLTPQDKLVEIVRRSRQLALEGQGGEQSEGGDEPRS